MGYSVTQATWDRIRKEEGLRLKPYLDTVGKMTIGYGRNLANKGISQVEANYLFNNDIQEVIDDLVMHLDYWPTLKPKYQAVLVDLCFNLGIAGLLQFKNMLAAMCRGDDTIARASLLDSVAYKQEPNRLNALAEIISKGE
jgi:lysozyme